MLSGRRLDLLDPSPLDIEISDIAHGLARVARWNGQTTGDHALSVAQHALVVEDIISAREPGWLSDWRLAALLHDAPEYVIGDLISPFKAAIGLDYKAFENRLLAAIHLRFGLPSSLPEHVVVEIKTADRIAAFYEASVLAGFAVAEAERIFGRPQVVPALAARLERLAPMPVAAAQSAFLDRFAHLTALPGAAIGRRQALPSANQEVAMPAFEPAFLADRCLVAVTGAEALAFLDNLVTADLDKVPIGEARFAALLSPQGKIQFEFFARRTDAGFVLDTSAGRAAELIKRLGLYKLRAKVMIAEVGRGVVVSPMRLGSGFADPRDARLGFRDASDSLKVADTTLYDAHRIALGIAEGGRDYPIGDTFPHEANYDLIAGVSFTKGCFVGQEVVARMQNKSVVRKRVVKISSRQPMIEGAAIRVGDAEIGRVGSVAGMHGLALLRLDRAAEAAAKGEALSAEGAIVVPDPEALTRYAKSVAERPVVDL